MPNPQPTPNPILGPHHGWMWAALPAEPGSIEVHGDPGLAAALADAGWSVTSGARHELGPAETIRTAAALPDGGLLTLAPVVPGWRGAAVTARLGRRLEAAGLDVTCIQTGDRTRRHRLRIVDGVRPARHPILVGSRGNRPGTALAAALAAAEAACGAPLSARGTRVLAGGTLLLELDGAGERRLLRVAGGTAGRLLERSEAVRRALAATAPQAVCERLVEPIAGGVTASVRWTLETKRSGAHPRRLSSALRADCLDFLVALRRAPVERALAKPGDDAAVVGHWVGVRERDLLERASARLAERLAGVARGWSHGDFWTGNLLVSGGRLATVLDWDAASSDGLPLVDLLHLTAYGDRSLRRLPHGLRCVRGLWPVAAAGGDEDIRRYCAATATPADAGTLEALAVAYWLERVARDLRTFADRAQRPRWMADNVHLPLGELEARGW